VSTDIYYCLTVTVLFLWGALSDERTGLSFVYAAGPCQRSLSRVRVPWDSRPYFTASHLSLPFSSPPTTRRVTVEVFDPASTRVADSQLKINPLRSLGANRTENYASNNSSIFARVRCLAMTVAAQYLPSNGCSSGSLFVAVWPHITLL
jgi:hypothetical protein